MGQRSRYAIGPDLVEELEEVVGDDDEDLDAWQAAFDPEVLTQANQPLSLDRFRLSEEELKRWAE